MVHSGRNDRDAAVSALLYVARREMLVLAIATCAIDDDGAAIASARLRWAISSARQMLHEPDPRMARRADQLERLARRAERWLVAEPPRSLQAIGSLVDRVAARRATRIPAIDAAHASLRELDLDDLDLDRIVLRGATLCDVTARHASCDAADASATRWLRCTLDRCSLIMAVLCGSTLERCDLSRADLDGTSWHRATLSHCTLARASLVDARLDRAVFTDCSLRGAELAIARSPGAASLAGARFVRCDLRETSWRGRELGGAAFIDCKLFGAHGAPAVTGVAIERADVSLLGDGSQLASPDEVIAGWRTMVGAAEGSPTPGGAARER